MNVNTGKPSITVGNRTITAGNGGPIVKVSSSTPVIQGPNGSVTLVVASSNSSVLSPSPNVSVTSTGKRIGGSSRVSISKERTKNDSVSKDASSNKTNKESKEITLKADLRNIMMGFGDAGINLVFRGQEWSADRILRFGDASSPSEDSVQLMEVILRQEMESFLFICDTAALLSGSKILGLREGIYAMKNDKAFLRRLFKHFAFKDQQQKMLILNQENQNNQNSQNQNKIIHLKNYVGEIRKVLEVLDESGELGSMLDTENSLENANSEILSDGNYHRLCITNNKYITYAKARSVSFARKLIQLQDWVTSHLHSECKLSHNFMELMSFLIYEMVAKIVDLSFIIKRERINSCNPMHRLFDTRGANMDTCMSAPAFQKKRKDEECNSVSEVLVQASELEAKRLKKITVSSNEVLVTRGVYSLSPSEIREAYDRMKMSLPPSVSFYSRAERIRLFSYQY